MSWVLLGVRWLLLMTVMSGYAFLAQRMGGIRKEFSLLLVVTGIGCAMYGAGILGILPQAWAALAAGGLLAFGYEMLRSRGAQGAAWLRCPAIVFFLCVSLYVLLYAYPQKLVGYDNFSHWALIIKNTLTCHRLPDATDTIITFQSYPPGTVCFIYFVCRVIGASEGCMIFGQSMITAACLLPLFALARKGAAWDRILIALMSLCAFSYNIKIVGLQVDTLLPMLGLAGVVIVRYSCEKEEWANLWCLVPLAVYLPLVKNSGLFFWAILCAAPLLYRAAGNKGRRRAAALEALLIGCPLAALYIWKRHVALVFPEGGLQSKHAMSLANMRSVFGEKSLDTIRDISGLFLRRCLSPVHNELVVVLLLLLLVLLLRRRGEILSLTGKRTLLLGAGSYLFYMISLYAMYLFSMPTEESLFLAGYDRYHRTILLFLAGLFVMELLGRSCGRSRGSRALAAAWVLVFALGFLRDSGSIVRTTEYEGSVRQEMDGLIETYHIPSGKKYMVYRTRENDDNYRGYLLRYLFLSPYVETVYYDNYDRLQVWVEEKWYDYFIILDEDEVVYRYLEQLGLKEKKRVYTIRDIEAAGL